VSLLEYWLASLVLRLLAIACRLLPVRQRRVVLATARLPVLEGNLLHVHDALQARRPEAPITLLLEPYSYRLSGKIRYLVRLLRGTYLVHTSGLVVVDNAYLPVHVWPHRPTTTVVQVWHAAGALKRFGADTTRGLGEPERRFLHRHYDYVVTSGEASREPWSRALRTPLERVLPLGTPRTDFFHDEAALAAARERVLARYPVLAGRRIVLHAPTFRGRGRAKRPHDALDGRRLRGGLEVGDALVLKTHPNLDPTGIDTAGYDVVVDRAADINELLAAADILVTDYSSSVFEFALLHRPMVLVMPDLEDFERDPGLYLDARTELVGTRAADTDEVIEIIREDRFDLTAYDAFVARHMGGCDGHAAGRLVERFVPAGR
jgi:CDP-glycerol glycerophosphotransferase (TagB/SpsB family)